MRLFGQKNDHLSRGERWERERGPEHTATYYIMCGRPQVVFYRKHCVGVEYTTCNSFYM